ncbi:benzoate/H(+) symporter BenE family transporter [Chitiniphilus purpureus]|uniref:Benzoate/H(+) symporter BenE family transporter n=1 Tax=Chitiniphilus purpureus TaxID=2981137 RepID=A0ABY6DIG7_9NEIS|nr:benzoate/H(+) symporter BenE family transporter [Chitiniphilus sp. CD1]UXY14137.1 benzoate/H(+) symporter BenE family transporter [Chitiniphilus sp. CD1]
MNDNTTMNLRTFLTLEQLKRDFSWQSVMAGLVAVIVGYAGPTVLVFQVAESAHLSNAQIISWLWAYSIAAGLTTIVASLWYRMPLITAWSTPGIAFLMTAMVGVPLSEAIGAFVLSNVLVTLIGAFGLLQKLVRWIPLPVASALNGGILVAFALGVISSLQQQPLLVGGMILAFFLVRRFSPRWAVAAVLAAGTALCLLLDQLDLAALSVSMASPVLTLPTFTWHATINIAIPLTVLVLTGQYLPGFAVLKTAGYEPPVDKVVTLCGTGSILVAPFGCHNINPSSMIAAIVAGPEAHPDKTRRYVAAVCAGVIYLVFGTFASTFVSLFASLPREAVAALAGLALLSAIASSFDAAFANSKGSLAPLVVFVIAASGITVLGVGAAFWAIVSGIVVCHVLERKAR